MATLRSAPTRLTYRSPCSWRLKISPMPNCCCNYIIFYPTYAAPLLPGRHILLLASPGGEGGWSAATTNDIEVLRVEIPISYKWALSRVLVEAQQYFNRLG